ncbi:MAG: hypothetical protein MZV64_11290 [Ignavibacteriales bacterium]|nr:hypothetical protein [Ignavibacteriales bacterium]
MSALSIIIGASRRIIQRLCSRLASRPPGSYDGDRGDGYEPMRAPCSPPHLPDAPARRQGPRVRPGPRRQSGPGPLQERRPHRQPRRGPAHQGRRGNGRLQVPLFLQARAGRVPAFRRFRRG